MELMTMMTKMVTMLLWATVSSPRDPTSAWHFYPFCFSCISQLWIDGYNSEKMRGCYALASPVKRTAHSGCLLASGGAGTGATDGRSCRR